MPKDIQNSINALYGSLVAELDHFNRGEQFHSIRELIRRHRVSRRVVEKNLARLEENGQIAIQPAEGIFVRGDREKTTRTIVCVHCDWPAEYWQNLDSAIEAELQKYPGFHFTRAFFEPNSGQDYLKLLNSLHCDVILFTFPIHHFSQQEIAAILNVKTPIVFLENNLLCDGINAIDSQPEFSGMTAAECLIRNGHRKLALILSEPWSIGDDRRNSGFLNYARLQGIEPEIIDCHMEGGDASCSKVFDSMLAHLRRNGPTFTGCFTMSDYSALGVISAIKEYGLRVPDDISIIGEAGIPSGAFFDPPLTTIAHDTSLRAAVILEGILDLFAGGSFGIRTVPTKLIERKSVKNITGGAK